MDKMSQLSLNSSKNISRSLTMISAAATAMAASVAGSFVAATEHAQHYALEMSRFAEKTGVSTEQFSKLAYSAKLAGVPVDMLKGAMERLARTSGTAQSGQKQATAAYAALGITVKDLQGPLSGSGDLLIAVSKKLEVLGDSTRKTNLEQRLLGRTGSELAPMLTVLGESFDASSEKALKFGVVISGSTAAEARKFQTTMVELESVALGFSLRLLEKVSPAIREVSNRMIEAVTSSNGLKVIGDIGNGIATGLRALGDAFEFLVAHATAVKFILEGLVGLQVASIFVPMVMGANAAGKGLDSIGLVAIKMIGKLTGITQLGVLFNPMAAGVKSFVASFSGFGVAMAEGTAATNTAILSSTAYARSLIAGIVPALTSAGAAALTFARTLVGNVGAAIASLRTAALAVNVSNLKFVFMDAAIAAEMFAANMVGKVNVAVAGLQSAALSGAGLQALKANFISAAIVAENFAGILLNRVRLAIVTIQGLNLASVGSAITGIISLATPAISAIGGITIALGRMAAVALLNPLTWVVLAAAAVVAATVALYKFRDATITINGESFHLRDTWNAAWLSIKDQMSWVSEKIKNIWSDMMQWLEKSSIGSFVKRQIDSLVAAVSGIKLNVSSKALDYLEQARSEREGPPVDNGSGSRGQFLNRAREVSKKDAPTIPNATGDKIDPVKLKLLELAEAAEAAQSALANAGKNVDFERVAASASEANKIIDVLNDKLYDTKKPLLTPDLMSLIRVTVATTNNDLAQKDFMNTIEKGTQTIIAQTSAHDLLTAAIGKGAAAVRQAQIDSQINTKYANASDTFKNSDEGKAKIAAERIATANELAAADANTNKQALTGVQQQIDAELRLNAAILQGKDAKEAATLANQEAAIRADYGNRGSAGVEDAVAANKELYEAKKKQSDLERAASMNPAIAYLDEVQALKGVAKAAQEAGVAVSDMQMKAADKANWESYLASVDKTTLAVGNASDGVSVFFKQMARDTESAAQQVHDVLGGAFQSLNSMLEKLVEGQRVSFAEFFRGIAGQLAKLSIQKAEQGIVAGVMNLTKTGDKKPGDKADGVFGSIMGSLTGAKGPDATVVAIGVTNTLLTTANTFLATIAGASAANGLSGLGGLAAGLDSKGSSDSSGSSGGSSGGGFLSTLFNLASTAAGSYGGGFALGGDVQAGMSYDVGEMGREKFTPAVNGKITPNNQMDNGGHTFNIDARGSSDPAQTEVAIHRAMQSYYGPAIGGASVKATNELRLRRPPSARN
jgi:hypothetical protein